MRSFSHVVLAYDVNMRRNIPVYTLITRLTEEKHAIMVIIYCLAGCNICSALFGLVSQFSNA